MHKGILAGRMLDARRRIVAATETAVSTSGLDPAVLDALRAAQAEKRDDVRALYELEAIGPIIEALAQVVAAELEQAIGYLSQEEILAIPGLSKSSAKAIEAHFAALAPVETAVSEEG